VQPLDPTLDQTGQPIALDPNRPHGLDDLIDRLRVEMGADPRWLPSWADICRVRDYFGATWSTAQRSNDYSFATMVLIHLELVDRARATIEPYTTIGCSPHDMPIGTPCRLHEGGGILGFGGEDLPLPATPLICAWRVLAKHKRLSAMEIYDRARPAPPLPSQRGYRQVFPISGEVQNVASQTEGIAAARGQYRHPQALAAERIFVAGANDWTIHDIRVDGMSILAPHLDLPGFLFSSDIMGPHVPLTIVNQDQWIEIEARRVRGDAPRFFASVMGSLTGGNAA
jgi:hypothetical protein